MRAEDGESAVKGARLALENFLAERTRADDLPAVSDRPLTPVFDEARGVFVTLKHHPSGDLRGCIGFPEPDFPLRVALARATLAAATADPRFPPVGAAELGRLTLEISVLTVPERIDAEPRAEIPRRIVIGRDGLIVDGRGTSGLLLPQVAPEFGWDADELLAQTCRKAGLPVGAWKFRDIEVRSFRAEIYRERTPNGPVVAERATERPTT
ncbi:MAG: TIGR00296 family protein [Thermoplasmata archaeon]|nr:TIGR00296 family protein [Thermoplasmata archaeon]